MHDSEVRMGLTHFFRSPELQGRRTVFATLIDVAKYIGLCNKATKEECVMVRLVGHGVNGVNVCCCRRCCKPTTWRRTRCTARTPCESRRPRYRSLTSMGTVTWRARTAMMTGPWRRSPESVWSSSRRTRTNPW